MKSYPIEKSGLNLVEVKDMICSHIKHNYPELIKAYFRRKGKKYKYGTIKAGYILEHKSIHERPIAAKLKLEVGHWEGDTVRGSRNTGGFVTFTERKSGFELVRVIGQKYASIVTEATRQLFETIPQELKKTVTLDNGKEFVEHYMRKCLCGLDTYFADVGNAGQRGLNDNKMNKGSFILRKQVFQTSVNKNLIIIYPFLIIDLEKD